MLTVDCGNFVNGLRNGLSSEMELNQITFYVHVIVGSELFSGNWRLFVFCDETFGQIGGF